MNDLEGVVVARDSAHYTKVQSLVHTLERNQKRFWCNTVLTDYQTATLRMDDPG